MGKANPSVESKTPVGIINGETADHTRIVGQQPRSTDSVTVSAEDVSGYHRDAPRPVTGEPIRPFVQESVNAIESDIDVTDDSEIEYENDKRERVKRTSYDSASHDARRSQDMHDEAVRKDNVKKVPVAYREHDENNSPSDKPNAFKTLVTDTFERNTRNSRNVLSNRRSASQKKYVERRFSANFKSRMRGNGFFAQMVQAPNRDLGLHQIGVGWREVVALVEQAPEVFEQLLRDSGCVFDTIVPEPGERVDIDKIRAIVNTAENGVWVAVSKSPEVDVLDIERMQLVILDDMERGLAFHPIIAPMFNADFDGDQAFVFFNKWIADHANTVMDYIVNWEGRTNLSGDWIPSVGLAKGTDVKKYVREKIFWQFGNMGFDIDGIVNAMANILENEFSDDKMAMWVNLFRAARQMAGDNDIVMSRVIRAAYDFVRTQANDNLLHIAGRPIESNNFAQPRTDEDWRLFDVMEYYMEAELPNNWQAFRRLFHSFPGNIKGKNPPFRFNGDIGRSFAIDDRIRTEMKSLYNEEGDYYEVSTDEQWKIFHKMTAKYIASRKMAVQKERDERWQAARDAFRSRVVRRMAYLIDPDSMDLYAKNVDFSKGYPNPKRGLDFDFIELFTRAYNIEVSNANQADAKFADRFGHVEWGEQKLIEVDRNGLPVDPASLAEPLLSVYPDLTIDNAFVFVEDRTSDPRWIGNPNHIDSKDLHSYENESGVIGENSKNLKTKYWMMKSKYSGYSLLKFSRRNNIIWSQSKATATTSAKKGSNAGKVTASVHTKYSDIKGSNSNAMLQYCLMLAIADKKTAAASTFQTGLIGNPYDRGTRQITHRGWFKYYNPTNTKYRRAGAEIRYVSVEGKDEDVRLGTPYQKSAFDKFSDLLCEMVDLDKKGIQDRALEIEAISFVVTELFPDMAHYFDMDTIEGFAESGYGRILMEHARHAMDRKTKLRGDSHKLVDYVASTWLSMVFDYEMDDVYRKSSILIKAETAEEISESTNALEFAWKKLANKSEVWEGIVREIYSGHEAWSELQRIAKGNTDKAKELLYPEYWKNPRHNDIIDVIQDTNLLFGEKVDIITDVVRYQTNNPWINTFEIPYGMRIADNQLYSINSANRKSAMGDITNFSDAYSSYAKTSRALIHEEVRKAANRWNTAAGRGRLLRSIRNLDRMPWLVRRLSDEHYSSSVVAILDKTTHQLEKGSQAEEPNNAYQSQVIRHNDGPYSDLYQTDGRVLGVISTENVGLSDFFSLLANPEKTITVYNRSGAMCQVNASALLFGDLNHDLSDEVEYEKALWRFLLDNPRIATMLRMHEMCSGTKGSAWVGVSKNGSIGQMIEFMGNENIDHIYNPIDHAKYITEIHPGMASLLVLCDPIGNRTSRMYQSSFEKTRNHLMYRMCEEARRAKSSKVGQVVVKEDVSSAAIGLLGEFGVTEDNMIRSNRSDYLERSDRLGLVETNKAGLSEDSSIANDTEIIKEAQDLYEIACDYAAKYIAEIANKVDFSTFPGMDGYDAPDDLESRSVGRESFLAFIDINQELGASKTSMSTGVNGMTTFDHVEWVRFINAQDQYVDIEWVMTCAEADSEYLLGFNGSLTSVMDNDGNFIPFEATVREETDENGNPVTSVVTNYDMLRELAGDDEIVIAGNGARLRDKSTRKDGRVMPALFKQMDSKRSKASEKLNLKLKKFGLDVLDSIIKMDGKYRTDMSYSELRKTLNDLYDENGHSLMATHLALGHQLYDAALELGYDDLSLSDFTCIASLMVIVGEDGNVYIRSIEQLSNAIRYATSRLDHEPSFKEMQEFVNRIVNDNTIGSGVGIMTFDPRETFDEWQPAKTASSTLPTRHVSSNETRNHAMLDTIEKEQYDPTKPDFTEADARELSNQILVYEKKSAQTKKTNGTNKTGDAKAKKPVFGEPRLKSVFERCQMAKDYIPIGGVGARSSTSTIGSDNTKAYSIAERFHSIPRNAIGPRYAYIIGDGNCSQSEIDRAVKLCYDHGLTMIVSNRHVEKLGNCKTIGKMSLANSLMADAMEASEKGDVIIPFFDMRLNGSEAMPVQGQGSMFNVKSYSGEYIASYESKSKKLGDAVVKMFRHLANRIRLVEEADMLISDDSLFRITYMNPIFDRCRRTVREATPEEVEEFIVNSGKFPVMDLGVNESDSAEIQQYLDDVAWAIERYRNRWIMLDGNVTDTVSTDLQPGDIVSWQVCDITDPDGNVSHVFAPVIPFQLHGSVSVPPVYSITGMTHENGMISVHWKNESGAPGNTVKSIDPMSGASKGVAYAPTDEYLDVDENGIFDDDRVVLKTGTMMDLAMEEAATSSRKEGTDKRLKTLVTLMVELRKLGFNYGNVEGAFPGRSDIAERLGIGKYSKEVREDEEGNQVEVQTGRITRSEWKELLEDPDFRFHETDQRIERFLRVECSKFMDAGWNPSDFMSNLLDYDDGNGIRNSGRMWEFETTLDPRLDYENDLLHFFHTVDNRFCPDGIDDMAEETDSGERYYFRMWRDDMTGNSEGYDKGQVQMEVPVKDSSGQWYDLWHNVYVGRGFFAKQTSMLGRPNISTSTFNPSAAHAMAYTHYGMSFGRRLESHMLNWALSNMRSNWSKRGGILDESAPTPNDVDESRETHAPDDAGVSNAGPTNAAGVPNVDVDAIGTEAEGAASSDNATVSGGLGSGIPARDMSPMKRFFGNYSPIIDAAYRQAEREQKSRDQKSRNNRSRQVIDEGKLNEAKRNFVSGNYVNESVADYLGVTSEELEFYKDIATDQLENQLGITKDDTAAYIEDYPMILQDLEDYLAGIGIDPDDINDVKQRFARIGAHKKKYGDMSSVGRGVYDIDFDNYDFTGKPIVSPIAMDVINGNVSETVRNNYIFEVEKKLAEDEGRLDEWLAYWSGESLRDQLDDQINGYDDLAEYLIGLRDKGVRTTISDVRKTENDARIGRKVQRKAELAYRKDSISGLDDLKTYQYTISYSMPDGPLDALSKIRDDLAAVIDIAKIEGDDFFPGNPNGNYGLLLELRDKCDARVQFALRYSTNKGEANVKAMEDLDKIRKLVKSGKLSGSTAAKSDLVNVISSIEATVAEIEALKHEARKLLNRDMIEDVTQRVKQEASQKLKEKRQEERQRKRQEEAEAIRSSGDWTRTNVRNGLPRKENGNIRRRVKKATAARLERSQLRLRNALLNDDTSDLEKEYARMGLAFIETIVNPLKINVAGFNAESRTRTTTRKNGKQKTITETRPSWGLETDRLIEKAQQYLGTSGGALRVASIAMCRMALGIASDGTISHVNADDFEVSERQFREVIKDIIAYCQKDMSPTGLSDEVRGNPGSNRDASGEFVVIAGTKRYPTFMPFDLWMEICSDPTSKFYVEGRNPRDVAKERFKDDVESWRQNVHNAIAAEGDIDQLIAIDNIAKAVMSMSNDVTDISLPEIKVAFDLETITADALRSDDPDIYVPLEWMRQQITKGAVRESRRDKYHAWNDGRTRGFIRGRNRLRKGSGSASIPIMLSSPVEEGENIVKGTVANALSNYAARLGERKNGDSQTRFDYSDSRYKTITTSRQWSENYRVLIALYRIGDWDLIDFYLNEKTPDSGRYVNSKFTEAELNSFLIRNGYIKAPNNGKRAIDRAANVTREAMAMAEKIMTDFATSEGLPGLDAQEARLFAKNCMVDARVLENDLYMRTERDRRLNEGGTSPTNFAYSVDTADAIATAETQGTGALMRKMISTQSGREAFMSMGFYGAGRKNPFTSLMNRVMWDHGVVETVISMCINSYPCYGIGKSLTLNPISSTACYLATCGYSGLGDILERAGENWNLAPLASVGNAMGRAADNQMGTRSAALVLDENGNIRRRRFSLVGLRKNVIYDAVTAGSTVGKIIITMSIIQSMGGIAPPDDPQDRLNYEEWKIGGEDGIPFKLAWWLDDLTGVSIPFAVGLLVNEGTWNFKDEDGNIVLTLTGSEMSSKIIENGIASMNDGTFVFEAIELFTHWDEHWRTALDMDALDNVGNRDGIVAPKSKEDWYVTTTRNILLDQFGQMAPAFIDEIVPTSQDCVYAGERNQTSPYLQWDTKGGTISVEEARRKGLVTGIDDWHEVSLREITRKYWVLGQIMDVMNWGMNLSGAGSNTGYTWAEMPAKERVDQYAYAKWKDYSFDFKDIPKKDIEGYLTAQGEAAYRQILDNYDSAEDAIADGFYLSHDALANARSYCESKMNQLESAKNTALDDLNSGPWRSDYYEIKEKIRQEIQRQYDDAKKVSDILWDQDFPSSVPKYRQQTSSYSTRYVDSEGNPSTYTQYLLGNATKERYAYGDMPNPLALWTHPRQQDKLWNYESPTWNMVGNDETDHATAKKMYHDIVDNNLTYEHRNGTVEDLSDTYFGGTRSPKGLMLSADDLPTTGTRVDVAKQDSLPSYMRTQADLEDYYKRATGLDFGGADTFANPPESTTNVSSQNSGSNESNGSSNGDSTSGLTGIPEIDDILREYGIVNEDGTVNGDGSKDDDGGNGNSRYSYRYSGSRSYYRGGSRGYSYGGSSYNPKIYSTSRNVSARSAAGMSTRQPYKATTTYLRPAFYTSGSHNPYLKMS